MTKYEFGTVLSLPSGSELSALVECQNTNAWSGWELCENGQLPWMAGYTGYVQFLSGDSEGWHGTTLRLVNGEKKRVGGQGQPIDRPWFVPETGLWRRGYVRRATTVIGAWKDEVWPKEEALRVKTSRSSIFFKCKGSPSRCLYVEGDYNDVTVDVSQGEQSNNVLDLAAVNFKGKGNVLRGVAYGQLCAAFFDGPDNRTLGFSGRVRGIGADRGAVYWRRGSDGFRATYTTVSSDEREFPCEHGDQAYYIDDRTSGGTIYDCAAYGPFTRGVMVHGGSNVRIDRLRSFGPSQPYAFLPHFTQPTVTPLGNSVTGLKTVG